jgi:hypothetical protein
VESQLSDLFRRGYWVDPYEKFYRINPYVRPLIKVRINCLSLPKNMIQKREIRNKVLKAKLFEFEFEFDDDDDDDIIRV